jgi:FtsP/CotA-like multicopper oxidase with cupredoxin domain
VALTSLLLLSCDGGGDRGDRESTPHESATDSGAPDSGGDGRPVLPSLADAEDLDPAEASVHYTLTADVVAHSVRGVPSEGYGYNGAYPGVTLRAVVGDTVSVDFTNNLDLDTTVHWHGMAVPNAMDGVSWVQSPLAPGESFAYAFVATRAGTFWYHPHVEVAHEVDLGLYGAFVVSDPSDPVATDDRVIVFDAWGESDEDEEESSGDMHHLPPDPNSVVWLVNGVEDPVWTLGSSPSRARLINASNTSYLSLSWPGARLIGGEQGLLAAEGEVSGLLLPPGGRAEVEVDPGAGDVDVTTAMWTVAGGDAYGEARRLFTVQTGASTAEQLDFRFSGAPPSSDPTYTDLVYVFQGGGESGQWLINGEAWPEVTPSVVSLGSEQVIEVRNLSETSHPFHLHGYRVEVLSVDGVQPNVQTYGDTVDVPIRSTVRLLLTADNAGDWALHCHLLGHEEGGMMTILRVE